jgi:hypothetical protein
MKLPPPPSQTVFGSAFDVALLLFAACSRGTPSAGDGKAVLQNRICSESEGRITLVRFEKTDAQQGEVFGVPFYTLEWTAEIEFTQPCKWVTGLFGLGAGFHTRAPTSGAGKGYWDGFLEQSQYPGVLVNPRDRATLWGAVIFRKTEKGWKAEQCTVAKYQLLRGK